MNRRSLNSNKGRQWKLSHDQIAAVLKWHAAIQALGTKEKALREAERTWQQKRRALVSAKELANHLGIARATLSKYARQLHKPSRANGMPTRS